MSKRFWMVSPDGKEAGWVAESDTARAVQGGALFGKSQSGVPISAPVMTTEQDAMNKQPFGSWVKRAAINAIPAVGATTAQMMASPLAAASAEMGPLGPASVETGAAMAGAIPASLIQQLLRGQSPTWKATMDEAKMQGALSIGGRALSGIAKASGRGLMGAAMRPSPALKAEFGDVVGNALDQGAVVGKGPSGVAGSTGAVAARQESSTARNSLLSAAGRRGRVVTAQDVEAPLNAFVAKMGQSTTAPTAKAQQAQALVDDFMNTHFGPNRDIQLAPMKARELQRDAAKLAKGLFGVDAHNVNATVSAEFNRSLEGAINNALDTKVGSRLNVAETKVKNSIGVAKAVRQAELRSHGIPVPGLKAGAIGRMPIMPEVTSRAAHVANNPLLNILLQYGPRAFQPGFNAPDTTGGR